MTEKQCNQEYQIAFTYIKSINTHQAFKRPDEEWNISFYYNEN